MIEPVLTLRITAQTMAQVRARARHAGELLGLDELQRTRFTTAVSEIARNAVQFAGEGKVTFLFDDGGDAAPQRLVAQVSDAGPGMPAPGGLPNGRLNASGNVPTGLAGSRRLVDRLEIESVPTGGTLVQLEMLLPRRGPRLGPAQLAAAARQLARRDPQSPLEELEHQNRELLATLEQLRSKQAELELADLRKNQFLATLAHELRNPLSTIHMSVELMRRRELTPEQLASRRDVIGRQVDQITKLIEDLMDVSRVSQGKVELALQPVEIGALVREAVEMVGGAVASCDHRLLLEVAPEPLWVNGDATRLKQVFCNLLHNSTRYTPSPGSIQVRLAQAGAYAVVVVADDGIGIAAEFLPHIFGLFVQGDNSRSGKDAGLGVGLTLVRHLVQDHGGSVLAASEGAGKGSTFTVTLPLVPPPGA